MALGSVRTVTTLLLLLALLVGPLRGQSGRGISTIHGVAEEYANQLLEFTTDAGFITGDRNTVGQTTIGPDGRFNVPLRIMGTQRVECRVGQYLLYFYAEQGGRYEIGLPPYRPMGDAERLNPFFEATELQLRLRSDNGGGESTNDLIARYDAYLAQAVDSAQRLNAATGGRFDPQPIIEKSRRLFGGAASPFARAYMTYQEGTVAYIAQSMKSQQLSDSYFKNRPILYDNPAYRELFNAVYDRYFQFHARTSEGEKIHTAISKNRSLGELKGVLRQNENLRPDSLLELVILKGLHDEFFASNFSRRALAEILDSLNTSTAIAEHAFIANLIREKVSKLLPGFAPQPIELTDTRGERLELRALRGKPVLLVFAMTTSYTCLQDFEALRSLHKSYGHQLEIVTICADEKPEGMAQYLAKADYPWRFAHLGEQHQLLKAYDVRVYPTYYLLDEKGLLVSSPAPGPQEGLERLVRALFKQKGWVVKRR